MNKLLGIITVALVLLLTSCTVTLLPGEEAGTQQRIPAVGSKPIGPTVQPSFVFPLNQPLEYKCTEIDLSVRYLNNFNLAEVYYEGQWNQLPRVYSSSGMNFSNGVYAWNTDGRTAYLQKNGVTVAPNCRY